AVSASSRPKPPATPPNRSQPLANQPIAPAAGATPSQTAPSRNAAAAAAGDESAYSSAEMPLLDSSNQFITSCVKATIEGADYPSASLSSAVLDEPVVDAPPIQAPKFQAPKTQAPKPQAPKPQAPKINVDPMMAEKDPSQAGPTSFSEMTELPPLKEIYIAPAPSSHSTSEPDPSSAASFGPGVEQEKPKVQPREVAEKAMKEIKNVPPRLMIYSIAGAAVLILIIAIALVMHVNSLNSDGDTPRSTASDSSTQPAQTQPTAQAQP